MYFIGHFLGTEKKQKGQVFNTYCVRVFSTPLFCRLFLAVSIVVFIEWQLGRIVSPRAGVPVLNGIKVGESY